MSYKRVVSAIFGIIFSALASACLASLVAAPFKINSSRFASFMLLLTYVAVSVGFGVIGARVDKTRPQELMAASFFVVATPIVCLLLTGHLATYLKLPIIQATFPAIVPIWAVVQSGLVAMGYLLDVAWRRFR